MHLPDFGVPANDADMDMQPQPKPRSRRAPTSVGTGLPSRRTLRRTRLSVPVAVAVEEPPARVPAMVSSGGTG
jgi:hypothetical protein